MDQTDKNILTMAAYLLNMKFQPYGEYVAVIDDRLVIFLKNFSKGI